MPAVPAALAALVQTNVSSRMAAVSGYAPMAQENPQYYIEFAKAIGTGIIMGGPEIMFTTADTGQSGIPPRTPELELV